MSTPAPPPDPAAPAGDVTALEKRLADAAAEVASVQQQLSEARAADPNHPDVPVPYAGHAPVVMINGTQVQAGQAIDLSTMLGVGATGQALAIPPVVTLNGQVVSGGQPVDLSAMIGPEAVAHIRSSLDQLGMGQLSAMFGPATTPSGSPPPSGSLTQPGPAAAMPYSTTPGEVTGRSNKALLWFAAVLVLGLIGVLVYLAVTG